MTLYAGEGDVLKVASSFNIRESKETGRGRVLSYFCHRLVWKEGESVP